MKAVIFQKYACHSEVIGFLMYLCKLCALEVDIYANLADIFSMTPMFVKLLGMESQCKVYEFQALLDVECDIVLLPTADEWYHPNEIDLLHKLNKKVLAIGHSVQRIEPFPFQNIMHLCPYNPSKYLFPVYPSIGTIFPQVEQNKYPGFMIIGVNNWKLKDRQDIIRYLDTGRYLSLFSRQAEDDIDLLQLYPSRVKGIYGLTNDDFMKAILPIKYVWCPYHKESEYSYDKFSNAIALAVNMNKILIIPEHLAISYELQGCVISYKSTVLEIFQYEYNEYELLQNLSLWKEKRAVKNIKTFTAFLI